MHNNWSEVGGNKEERKAKKKKAHKQSHNKAKCESNMQMNKTPHTVQNGQQLSRGVGGEGRAGAIKAATVAQLCVGEFSIKDAKRSQSECCLERN